MKYRPISPRQAWSSVKCSEMSMAERFCEAYLLTSPATNAIGCYELVPRIAAAEMGVPIDDLNHLLSRLEELGVAIYRDGFILVRTWFLHSTWESTFQGNVAKRVARELPTIPAALRPLWEQACIEAGVPPDVVTRAMSKPLDRPSRAPLKGLGHTNATEQQPSNPTEPSALEGGSSCPIHLSAVAECHRVSSDIQN